jgi:hypothetical protein
VVRSPSTHRRRRRRADRVRGVLDQHQPRHRDARTRRPDSRIPGAGHRH